MKWIKLSDRLPDFDDSKKNEKQLLVTVNAPERKVLAMNYCKRMIGGREILRWEWREGISPWEVIAWAEMPEPYQDEPAQLYTPTCPRGYTDCIGDPAYIKFFYPEWYKEIYGDKTPEEAAEECRKMAEEDPDEKYYCYDDEDK